jgi:hypothetical protein
MQSPLKMRHQRRVREVLDATKTWLRLDGAKRHARTRGVAGLVGFVESGDVSYAVNQHGVLMIDREVLDRWLDGRIRRRR